MANNSETRGSTPGTREDQSGSSTQGNRGSQSGTTSHTSGGQSSQQHSGTERGPRPQAVRTTRRKKGNQPGGSGRQPAFRFRLGQRRQCRQHRHKQRPDLPSFQHPGSNFRLRKVRIRDLGAIERWRPEYVTPFWREPDIEPYQVSLISGFRNPRHPGAGFAVSGSKHPSRFSTHRLLERTFLKAIPMS